MKKIYHETKKYGKRTIFVDDDVYDFIINENHGLSFYSENAKGEPYVSVRVEGVRIPLHRFVIGVTSGNKCQIDHIDKHPLNNIRTNLRETDFSGNAKNRNCPVNNKSTGLIGITKHHDCIYASIRTKDIRLSSKGFSIKKNGYDRALYKAVKWRVDNALRFGFTIPEEHIDILKIKPKRLIYITRFKSGITIRDNRFVFSYYDGEIRNTKSFGFKKYGSRSNAYIEAKIFRDKIKNNTHANIKI